MNYEESCAAILALPAGQPLAIDIESTGLHPFNGDVLRGASFAYRSGDDIVSAYFPFTHPDSPNVDPAPFAAALNGTQAYVLGWNYKFDSKFLAQIGVRSMPYYDGKVISFLLDENENHGLKPSAKRIWPAEDLDAEQRHLKELMASETKGDCYRRLRQENLEAGIKEPAKDTRARVEQERRIGKTWATLTYDDIRDYAALDAVLTLRLREQQMAQAEFERISPAVDHYLRFEQLMHRMECAGVLIDTAFVQELVAGCEDEIADIEAQFPGINLGSAPQLVKLVYGEWGLEPLGFTGKGAPSVSREALELLEGAHPGLDTILRHRKASKLASGFLAQLLSNVDAGGRVHPSFNASSRGRASSQTESDTVTGRLTCVAEDTLIEMPRDMVEFPAGVPITSVRPGDWVYAFDWERELVLRQVKWVRQTGVRQTVAITAENSDGHRLTLRATPDHLIRMRNGDWRPAGSLLKKWGDATRAQPPRLMTMVRRAVDDGYIKFFPHSVARGNGQGSGGKNREHRWVVEQVTGKRISTKTDVHHIDGNRANNHPDNLEPLTVAEHRGRRHLHPWWGDGAAPVAGIYEGPTDYRALSVEPGPVEPVWDMEVEGVHNFIANGVCVHNCSSPNLQQRPRDLPDGVFCAPAGYELWSYDMSQAELRIAASIAEEPAMIDVFLADGDIYLETAEELGIKRPAAKTLRLSSVYGIGARKLARKLLDGTGKQPSECKYWLTDWEDRRKLKLRRCNKCDSCAARDLLDNYWASVPHLAMVNRNLIDYAEGAREIPLHVEGRYRRYPTAQECRSRGLAAPWPRPYTALNSVIQGGCAELLKLWLLHAEPRLAKIGARIVCTIHDSVTLEVATGRHEAALRILQESLDAVTPAGWVPILLDPKKGI